MSIQYNKGTKSITIDDKIIKDYESITQDELKQIQEKLARYEKLRDSSKNPDHWQKKYDLLKSSADTLTFPEINNWEKELEDPPPKPPLEAPEHEDMDIDLEIDVDDIADFDEHFTIDEYDAKIEELHKKQYAHYHRDPSETKEDYYSTDYTEDNEWIAYYNKKRKKLLDAMSIKERSAYDYRSKRSISHMEEVHIEHAENLAKELEVVEKELSTILDNDDFDYNKEIEGVHVLEEKRDAIMQELEGEQWDFQKKKKDREDAIKKSIDSIMNEGKKGDWRRDEEWGQASKDYWIRADPTPPIVTTGRSIYDPETRETKPEIKNIDITDIIKDIEAKESIYHPGLESLISTYSDGGTINKGNNNMTEEEYKAKMESGGYRHGTGTPIINDLLSLVIGEENIPDKILSGTGEFIGESATGLGEYIQQELSGDALPSLLSSIIPGGNLIKMGYDKYNKPSSNAHQNIDSLLQDENIKNILPMLMNTIRTMTGIGTGPQLPDIQKETIDLSDLRRGYDNSLQGVGQGMQQKKLDPKIKSILQSHVDSLTGLGQSFRK